MSADPRIIHLAGGAVSVVLEVTADGPRVLHWGARLDGADARSLVATADPAVTFSSFDEPRRLGLLPVSGEGWSGTPAVAWHRAGAHSDPQLRITDVAVRQEESDGTVSGVVLTADDADAEVRATVSMNLDHHGILSTQIDVLNMSVSGSPLEVAAVRAVMPLPTRASELLDFAGRWTRERTPQRHRLVMGAHQRATRRGRPGHDAPFLTLVGQEGFDFRDGELWGVHVAWSGDHEVTVERLPEEAGVHSSVIVAGELLAPGEIRLGPGESYRSPLVLFAWADAGIDGVSDGFHAYVRDLASYPASPRPLTLNTWEAVYFDHDPARLIGLADIAARVGVERFVLDDGWFAGRQDDTSGLGDWVVDTAKWPQGVGPLADAVHGYGMQFGLWFEPEMVNRDSELARRHPDWILGSRTDAPEWRHQLVLDLTREPVREYLLERIDHCVRTLGLDYIKWDHNRDLHGATTGAGTAPAVHRQTRAVYALIDALRERHPGLEIESCASGGARLDLGILSRMQRVWPSDTNDPVERQMIQRWTGVLVPPELVGSHVGPPEAHTTRRTSSVPFRLATALFGHAGIEWDLTNCSEGELAAIAQWAALYKELRPLLHGGRTVRADVGDSGALLHGIVSPDRVHAVFAWVRTATSGSASTPRTRIPGLDPTRRYRITVREDLGRASRHSIADPPWMPNHEPLVASGRFLGEVGLPLPLLDPGAAMLVEMRS